MSSSTFHLFVALDEDVIDMDKVKQLLQTDVDWKQTVRKNNRNYTPLHLAAYHGEWEAVEVLVRHILVTQQPIGDADAIQFGAAVARAVTARQTELVSLMLTSDFAKKSNKSAITKWQYTYHPQDRPLHSAIRNNDVETLKLLLEYGYPLNEKNDEHTPAELAEQKHSFDCLVEIAARIPLAPSCFAKVSGQRLLQMMLRNIPLKGEGYQAEELQDKRGKVLQELINLPDKDIKLRALRFAKNKSTLLGDYMLNYKQGFFVGLFNSENSAAEMEKRIDAEIDKMTPKKPRSTTTDLYDEFDVDDVSQDEGVELAVTAMKPASDSDNDTVESESVEEDVQAEKAGHVRATRDSGRY